MDYTPWMLLVDFGLISGLILVGQFLRAKVKLFQNLFIPASLIAGFLGLFLGSQFLDILPFSGKLGTYTNILVLAVFGAIPLGQKFTKSSILNRNAGGMFFNVVGMVLFQFGVFALLGLLLLSNLHPGFGIMIPAGFSGGHGVATAVASTFAANGWDSAGDIGMTTATFGIIGGILFGVVMINWAARKGYTSYVTEPSKLSKDLLTGLIEPENQKPGGKVTVSGICLDTYTFHVGLVTLTMLLGYWASEFLGNIFPTVTIPEICTCLIAGILIQCIMSKTNTDKYVDRFTISRISGCATDFVIVCGVASVNVSTVLEYFVPLVSFSALAFVLVISWLRFVAPWCSDHDWFERGMIAFGQATGVLATGVLLLRVVDPDLKSNGIEDSGTVNLVGRPIIVAVQLFMPLLLSQSLTTAYMAAFGCLGAFVVLLIIALKFKWLRKPTTLMGNRG